MFENYYEIILFLFMVFHVILFLRRMAQRNRGTSCGPMTGKKHFQFTFIAPVYALLACIFTLYILLANYVANK